MSPRRDWPLAGREEELAEISALRRTGTVGAVLICGPPGVGKTRLAAEAVAGAQADGCATHWATATRATTDIPFGALAHLLPEDDDDARRSTLSRLQIAGRALRRAARDRSLVVGIDDIDLLDNASAALVHHAVDAGIATVIATVRAVERLPDVMSALWRQGSVRYLDLEPLTEPQTSELLGTVLGEQVDGGARRRFHHLSQGNPLYLRELVRAAKAAGTLHQDCQDGEDTGVWRLRGGPLPAAPLVRHLAQRLERADAAVRDVVETVALGEPVGVGLVRHGRSADRLEDAEAAGFIRVHHDGRRQHLRLAHPLDGEVIRTDLPRLRRMAVYRGLAEALVVTGARRRGDLLRLAVWQLESGARTNPRLLLTAAREAARRSDHRLAGRLALAAREADAGFPAILLAAEAFAWQGRTRIAEKLFRHAGRAAAGPGQRAQVAYSRGMLLFLNSGRLTSALRVLERTGAAPAAGGTTEPAADGTTAPAEDGTADEAMRLVARAFLMVQAGRVADGLRVLEPVAADPPDDRVRRHALPILANALTAAGRTREALRCCRRAARVLRARPGAGRPGGGTVDRRDDGTVDRRDDRCGFLSDGVGLVTFNALMYQGLLPHADRLTTARYERALDADHDQGRTAWAYARGRVAFAQGRFATAERWLREALHLLRDHPTLMGPASLLTCLGDLALITTVRGEPAAGLLREAEEKSPENLFAPDYELASAWVDHLHGRTDRARGRAEEIAARATALGGYAYAARAWHALARFGVPGPAVAPLNALAERAQGPVPRAFAAHATALRDGDAAGLGRCAAAFGRLGMTRVAAEAAGAAAAGFRRSGRHLDASAAVATAARYARRCDGVPIRAMLPDDPVAALTDRERELAVLAAAGQTNRDIADRLVLSVRTVENHLHRAYAKLGVTRRDELSGFLWDDGA